MSRLDSPDEGQSGSARGARSAIRSSHQQLPQALLASSGRLHADGIRRLARPIVVDGIRACCGSDASDPQTASRGSSLPSKQLGDKRDDRASSTARNALIVGGIGLGTALLLILLGAIYVNRAVAQPVRSAAAAAARIAGGDFSGRLRTDGPGEVGRLERTFNTMAASLERTLADLKERNQTLVESERTKSELVSNVSHELRTPAGERARLLRADARP